MFFTGVLLTTAGIYLIMEDIIDINILIKEGEIRKKEDFKADTFYELKALVGIFAIMVGIFSLINYFYM